MRLIPVDLQLVDAAREGDARLARALGLPVTPGWNSFPGALDHVRATLVADPVSSTAWGSRMFVAGEPAVLVGWGGFKGPPREGTVELGYEIAESLRERGLATAAIRAMLDEAFASPDVRSVIAHTLAEENASVRLLRRAGFAREAEFEDDGQPVWRHRLTRPAE